MTMFVFAGPTLPAGEIARTGNFVCLPPVAQGDCYRAAQRRPRAIGIIDGYFSGAPSVWHKEILWAISQGVPVFGSASMGALRAAELHAFGMRGVGRIFEAFRDGALEDDDEVAVVHGPAELDYLAASEAMVNIRATLARAEADSVVSLGSRRALEAFAKSLFFPQRSWETLLEAAVARGVGEAERDGLGDWLPRGRIDQKRLDALEMLAAMQEADYEKKTRRRNSISNGRFSGTNSSAEPTDLPTTRTPRRNSASSTNSGSRARRPTRAPRRWRCCEWSRRTAPLGRRPDSRARSYSGP